MANIYCNITEGNAASLPSLSATNACTVKQEAQALPAAGNRLDPRASFAILLLLNVTAFAPTNLWVEAAAVVATAAVVCWCGRFRAAAKWCVAYAVLLALTVAAAAFPHPVLASFATMLVLVRRVFCIGMFGSNLIATTRVGELACALQRAHVPRGVVVAVSVGLRFFPTIAVEFKSVVEAMRVRGVALSPKTLLCHPMQVMEDLFVPVMSRFAIVVDELGNAAVARGIDSNRPRTSYYDLSLGVPEVLATAAFALVAAAVFLIKAGVLS